MSEETKPQSAAALIFKLAEGAEGRADLALLRAQVTADICRGMAAARANAAAMVAACAMPAEAVAGVARMIQEAGSGYAEQVRAIRAGAFAFASAAGLVVRAFAELSEDERAELMRAIDDAPLEPVDVVAPGLM